MRALDLHLVGAKIAGILFSNRLNVRLEIVVKAGQVANNKIASVN
jgi:hypothetical protein